MNGKYGDLEGEEEEDMAKGNYCAFDRECKHATCVLCDYVVHLSRNGKTLLQIHDRVRNGEENELHELKEELLLIWQEYKQDCRIRLKTSCLVCACALGEYYAHHRTYPAVETVLNGEEISTCFEKSE